LSPEKLPGGKEHPLPADVKRGGRGKFIHQWRIIAPEKEREKRRNTSSIFYVLLAWKGKGRGKDAAFPIFTSGRRDNSPTTHGTERGKGKKNFQSL